MEGDLVAGTVRVRRHEAPVLLGPGEHVAGTRHYALASGKAPSEADNDQEIPVNPTDRTTRPAWRVPNLLAGRRPVSRRRFLEMVAAAGAGAMVAPFAASRMGAQEAAAAEPLPAGYVPSFPEGVASGDPRSSTAVIWTRLAPPTGGETLPVLWEVAEDPGFGVIAAGGTASAAGSAAHSVKLVVDDLAANRWYWYRFAVGDTTSPTGRLRTAPDPGSSPDRLRFAYASCQQRTRSTYVAHAAIAREPDLAFFMHQGDYIYAHDTASLTVPTYRDRWKLYTGNPLLQELRAALPLVMVWDDGEFYNGVDRFSPPDRLAAAKQVFFENMPLFGTTDDPTRTYRSLPWGRLVDFLLLDTRSYRDPEVPQTDTRLPGGAERLRADRTHLGPQQLEWLRSELIASEAAWRVLGSSVNMAAWRFEDLDEPWPREPGTVQNAGVYATGDAWDDYVVERRDLLQFLADRGIVDNLVCSAHTHLFIGAELQPDYDDPTSPTVAYDFTSASLTADPDVVEALMEFSGRSREEAITLLRNLETQSAGVNPHQKYLNLIEQGYVTVDVTEAEAVVEFKAIDTYDPHAESWVAARFIVRRGSDALVAQRFSEPGQAPPYEPEMPPSTTTTSTTTTTASTVPDTTSTTVADTTSTTTSTIPDTSTTTIGETTTTSTAPDTTTTTVGETTTTSTAPDTTTTTTAAPPSTVDGQVGAAPPTTAGAGNQPPPLPGEALVIASSAPSAAVVSAMVNRGMHQRRTPGAPPATPVRASPRFAG
ncbi:MAG: alkaline phosphatase D family protein [Acidimicrobiia bacterium]|nr:alkaline phosphatase D family protein [Acidimicrobiia bacterium]